MIMLNTKRNTNFVDRILESRCLGIKGLATCEKCLNFISNFGFREISAFQLFLLSQLVAFLHIEGIFQMHSPVKYMIKLIKELSDIHKMFLSCKGRSQLFLVVFRASRNRLGRRKALYTENVAKLQNPYKKLSSR